MSFVMEVLLETMFCQVVIANYLVLKFLVDFTWKETKVLFRYGNMIGLKYLANAWSVYLPMSNYSWSNSLTPLNVNRFFEFHLQFLVFLFYLSFAFFFFKWSNFGIQVIHIFCIFLLLDLILVWDMKLEERSLSGSWLTSLSWFDSFI